MIPFRQLEPNFQTSSVDIGSVRLCLQCGNLMVLSIDTEEGVG